MLAVRAFYPSAYRGAVRLEVTSLIIRAERGARQTCWPHPAPPAYLFPRLSKHYVASHKVSGRDEAPIHYRLTSIVDLLDVRGPTVLDSIPLAARQPTTSKDLDASNCWRPRALPCCASGRPLSRRPERVQPRDQPPRKCASALIRRQVKKGQRFFGRVEQRVTVTARPCRDGCVMRGLGFDDPRFEVKLTSTQQGVSSASDPERKVARR